MCAGHGREPCKKGKTEMPFREQTLVCLRNHILKLIHTAMLDTTKLSCMRCIRFGSVNWIPDNSRLSTTENLKSEHVNSNCPIHTATTDRTVLSCLVWQCELNRLDECILCLVCVGWHTATTGCTPTQNPLSGPT